MLQSPALKKQENFRSRGQKRFCHTFQNATLSFLHSFSYSPSLKAQSALATDACIMQPCCYLDSIVTSSSAIAETALQGGQLWPKVEDNILQMSSTTVTL